MPASEMAVCFPVISFFYAAWAAVPPTIVIGVIAFVTCRTGSCLQGLRMAIAAGCAAMVDTAPAFVGDARVRTGVRGKPVVCAMAVRAIQTKHSRMEGRIAVAACTVGR